MFIIEIVLLIVMGLSFLWFVLSMMFEKPDSNGFISAFVAIGFIFVLTLSIIVGSCSVGLYNFNHDDDKILAELIRKDRSNYHLEFESNGSFRCKVYYLDNLTGLIGETAMRRETYRTYFDDSLKVNKELLQKLVHNRLSDNKLTEGLDEDSAPKICK